MASKYANEEERKAAAAERQRARRAAFTKEDWERERQRDRDRHKLKRKVEPDYVKRRDREYYRRSPETAILGEIRKRCIQRGIPFGITADDIRAPELCPILGIPLRRGGDGRGPSFDSPSVDRIVPELGYVRGNVIVVSHLANSIKSNATPEQIIRVGVFYARLLAKKIDDEGLQPELVKMYLS